MATKYQMQAKSSADAQLYSWLANAPDFAAAGYPGPGSAQDVALTGGGIDDGSGASIPSNAMKFTDGSYVVFTDGSYVVTA